MTMLTSAIKRKITADWNSAMPELAVYKPMWLLRRCGPLLMGVCLDRDSSGKEYLPKAHIHCLANPEDNLYLDLCQRLRTENSGAEDWIDVRWHENRWREAASRMVKQSLLPLSGPISLDQVEEAFRAYQQTSRNRYATNTWQDWLLTLAWARKPDRATSLLREIERAIATWPEHIAARDDGLAEWLHEMRESILNSDKLNDIVLKELVKHKADKLPSVDVSAWLK